MFKQARLKLTIGYTSFFAVVILLFSAAFHFSQVRTITSSRGIPLNMAKHMQQLDLVDLNQRTLLEERLSERINTVTDQLRGELLKNIIVFDLITILIFIGVSYWLAGYTLLPLEQSYKLQQQFLQDASHELRTPLSVMQGEVDLALKKKTTTSQKNTLTSTKEEILNMSQLVGDILFLSRSGTTQINRKEKINLNKLVTKVVKKFKTSAQEKNQQLDLDINTNNQIEIKTRPDELKRVLGILHTAKNHLKL